MKTATLMKTTWALDWSRNKRFPAAPILVAPTGLSWSPAHNGGRSRVPWRTSASCRGGPQTGLQMATRCSFESTRRSPFLCHRSVTFRCHPMAPMCPSSCRTDRGPRTRHRMIMASRPSASRMDQGPHRCPVFRCLAQMVDKVLGQAALSKQRQRLRSMAPCTRDTACPAPPRMLQVRADPSCDG
jgi:hypothetical protein